MSTIAESLPGLTDSAIHAKGIKLSREDAPSLHVNSVVRGMQVVDEEMWRYRENNKLSDPF
jgi:hypothetical protein